MIFVTTGVQLPFDRLVKTVDDWAGRSKQTDVIAQVGASTFECRNITAKKFLKAEEFQTYVRTAELIVAHAGMGSIITALEIGKPIIVVPRRADLGEHRNDHQSATARRLSQNRLIRVAWDETELVGLLDAGVDPESGVRISTSASPELLEGLQRIIHQPSRPSLTARTLRPLGARLRGRI